MKSNLKLTVVYYVLNVDGLCCFELLGLLHVNRDFHNL